jgi:hypothetical protein
MGAGSSDDRCRYVAAYGAVCDGRLLRVPFSGQHKLLAQSVAGLLASTFHFFLEIGSLQAVYALRRIQFAKGQIIAFASQHVHLSYLF